MRKKAAISDGLRNGSFECANVMGTHYRDKALLDIEEESESEMESLSRLLSPKEVTALFSQIKNFVTL